MSLFSFLDFTKEEKREIADQKLRIKEVTEGAEETIRICLSSDSFAKYKNELLVAEKALMEVGIDIKRRIKDPNERVYLYDSIFTRAEVIGALLKKVEGDAR